MPISFRCPTCRAKFQVADKFAGRETTCRHCEQVFQVPASAGTEGPIDVAEWDYPEDDRPSHPARRRVPEDEEEDPTPAPRRSRDSGSSGFSTTLKVLVATTGGTFLLCLGCCGLGALAPTARQEPGDNAAVRPVAQPERRPAKTLTMAHYNAIQQGMSQDDVGQVIGWEGREVSRVGGFDGGEIRTVIWSRGLSSLTVIFDRGRVESKSQFGLR